MHQVNTVGNSPRVRLELAEGIGSLPGWRKGVHQKKTETHQQIVGGSRKACRERLVVRMPEVAKLAGWVIPPYPGVRVAEPPRPAGKSPISNFFGYV
ncbi:hypothetical protein B296_00041800 [Ensete ventricosum]|uniref:Uncharacterized protein n=1 Tax=Ensete ventricosum TaxID=4639 RepID=A0A426XS24_ENSVE|nr:hypothetical protein B296_00041800 [Ensete ventricosum]